MFTKKLTSFFKFSIVHSPYTILVGTIIAYLISNKRYLIEFSALYLLSNIIIQCLKPAFRTLLPNAVCRRPSSSPDLLVETSGFPSGHVTMISMFATFFIMKTRGKFETTTVLTLLVVLVSYQRYSSGSHDFPQILAGILFGIGFGLLANKMICRNKST